MSEREDKIGVNQVKEEGNIDDNFPHVNREIDAEIETVKSEIKRIGLGQVFDHKVEKKRENALKAVFRK